MPCTVLDDLEECVFNDTAPCFPTADVFFINITMNPKDPFPSWSPIYLDLTVDFIMKNFRYLRHYEFVNVFRCDLWIKESGIYQLGPRHGLVLKHKSMPTVGTWLRTWVWCSKRDIIFKWCNISMVFVPRMFIKRICVIYYNWASVKSLKLNVRNKCGTF